MILVYLYLLVAAFAGGYFLRQSIDEAEEGFVDPPPVIAAVMLSLIAPLVVASYLVGRAGVLLWDRIGR